MLTLPPGAGSGLAFARSIASDPARLEAAIKYWKKQFVDFGEDVMSTGSFTSEAMRFAQALPDRMLSALVKEFSGFFSAAEENRMVRRSGCLMSTEDLASTDASLDSKLLSEPLALLGALEANAASPSDAEREKIAIALQLAREVFDLCRRFILCTTLATQYRIPLAEVIAYFRQEGALGISPPRISWQHAPLIATADTGCRIHAFLLWDDEIDRTASTPGWIVGTTRRHGYVVSHAVPGTTTQPKKNPVSHSFGIALRQLNIMCGMDALTAPQLFLNDDIRALFDFVKKQPASFPEFAKLKKEVRDMLSGKEPMPQTKFFDDTFQGLMMREIDLLESANLPALNTIVDSVCLRIRELVSFHPALLDGRTKRLFLAAPEVSEDALACLQIGTSWFAGRRKVATLLSWRDRASYNGPSDLAPFLSYMRYNLGDNNFIRSLIFFATHIKLLRTAKAQRDHRLSADFTAAVGKVAWSASDDRLATKLLANWRTMPQTVVWRNVGLIELLSKKGEVFPKKAPASKTLELAASCAKSLLDLYSAKGLFDVLEKFALTHPLSISVDTFNFVALKIDDSKIFSPNFFSFERMRRVYADALKNAGL